MASPSQSDHVRPEISVILGRVSTEDGDRVLETIAALEVDRLECGCEIIIADRLKDKVSERIAREHPHVRLIACDASMSLPELRTIAFEQSTGSIVAVTEDHCVPAPGWLRVLRQAFAEGDPKLAAVGGSVVNGVTDSGFDWATFLCEYSYFSPPVAEGRTDVLPGMNVGYRRSVLDDAPREALTGGFWESTLHPLLLKQGGDLISLNALKMFHCKKFSVRLFVRQRFIYSRYYAGIRFRNAGVPKRLVAGAASLLLPPLLLWRMVTAGRAKGLGRELTRAMPGLVMLVFVWAIGEAYGAVFGAGDALAKVE